MLSKFSLFCSLFRTLNLTIWTKASNRLLNHEWGLHFLYILHPRLNFKAYFFSAQFDDEKRDAAFQGRYAKRGTIFQWKVRGAFSIMNGWSKGLDRGVEPTRIKLSSIPPPPECGHNYVIVCVFKTKLYQWSVKVRYHRHQKIANCFVTSLQNKLNSDVARFTTPIHENKPCNLTCGNIGSNVGGNTRNIAIQLFLQQCCKTSRTSVFS